MIKEPMNKIPFYILIIFSCAAAAGADKVQQAHIKVTAGPKRIQRPAVPQFTPTSGAGLKGALDPTNFSVGGSGYSRFLSGDASKLYATEHTWLPSICTRSSGSSEVKTLVTVALCPPSNGPQREAWDTLMIELGDPQFSDKWLKWQARISIAVLESRILGARRHGAAAFHVKITSDNAVEITEQGSSTFSQAIRPELKRLANSGIFKIPQGSEAGEVHVLILLSERPPQSQSW